MNTRIEHVDILGQPIQVGDHVSFTWSNCRSIQVGQIVKLTLKRIKIAYNYSYTYDNKSYQQVCFHIARPEDCLVLSEKLQQHLTMSKLQKKI